MKIRTVTVIESKKVLLKVLSLLQRPVTYSELVYLMQRFQYKHYFPIWYIFHNTTMVKSNTLDEDLKMLEERGLIKRHKQGYSMTKEGLQYSKQIIFETEIENIIKEEIEEIMTIDSEEMHKRLIDDYYKVIKEGRLN